MGAVDRVQTIFARPRAQQPKQAAVQSGAVVPKSDVLEVVTPDQARARTYSKRIPLIAETFRTAAMLGASCELRPEYLQHDGTWAHAENPGERDYVAEYALDSYRPREGTQAQLVYREYRLRERIGEAWRIQQDNQAGANWWAVHDPEAVGRQGNDHFAVARQPGGSVRLGTMSVVHRSMVQRVWDPDDTWDLWATSTVFAMLDECELYVALTRNTKRRLLSRLAGAGKLLWTPGEAHLPLPEDQLVPGGPTTDLEKALLQISVANAAESADNNVGAVAPPHLHWPSTHGKPEVIDLGEQIDPNALSLRGDLREEIAQGLPYPTQLALEGPGAGGNHWGDWLADDKAIQQVKARMGDICEGITVGVLRPTLQVLADVGLWLGDPERVRVGFNPAPITQDPNNFEQLNTLREAGVIGPGPVLREVGLGDDDRATEEERQAALEFMKRTTVETPAGVSTGRPPEPAKNQMAAVTDETAARVIATALHRRQPERIVVTAAAKPGIGDQLRSEDDRYRAELTAAVTTAMAEALRRAGVKLQSKAQRKSATVQASARDAAAAGRIDAVVLAAVGTDHDDLLRDSFDTLAATIAALLAAHRARQRKVLEQRLAVENRADLIDAAEWNQATEARAGAVRSWLPAAMTLAAASRLAGDVEPQGEQPAATVGSIPPPLDLVDAAVRVSNGAAVRDGVVDSPTPGRPDDAVGLVDPQIEAPLATIGVLPLYQWVYGDPGERDRNFEPHETLDGVTWDDDNRSEILANPESFPDGDEYFPGDHRGCLCRFEVVWSEGMAGDFGPEDITGGAS